MNFFVSENCQSLNFHLCGMVQQALYFDKHHGGKVFSHVPAIALTNFTPVLKILGSVGDVDRQPSDLIGPSTSLLDYGNHIRQRTIKLFDKFRIDDSLLVVPAHLAGNEEKPSRVSQDPIRVAVRFSKRLGID
jgi:hypothetical protein